MLKKSHLISLMLSIALLLPIILTGCGGKSATDKNKSQIFIAEQFGLAYAPIQIMKELKILEKNLPNVEINWRQLGNTAAIREAMLAKEVDAGFMAIPPFLIGWDKGMEWKIACGLSSNPVGLVTNKENINSIKDFTTDDRIAVPQPGSVQHILLSMASEKVFGDSHKLDDLLVTMAHPDGMNSLLAGKEITGHFTSPPYLMEELKQKGMKQVLSGKEAFGSDFTFIIGVVTKKFHDENPEAYIAFLKSVGQAVEYMKNEPEKASLILSKAYNMTEEQVIEYLNYEDVKYDLKVHGIMEFADFMKRNNYISKTPESLEEIFGEGITDEK